MSYKAYHRKKGRTYRKKYSTRARSAYYRGSRTYRSTRGIHWGRYR